MLGTLAEQGQQHESNEENNHKSNYNKLIWLFIHNVVVHDIHLPFLKSFYHILGF